MAVKWHDKKDVYMLSSAHDSSLISTRKRNSNITSEFLKPLCVKEYNENRGAVDKTAMQITFSESLRNTTKWYKKLFFHMIDLSVLNSFILFKTIKHQNFQLSKFKLEIIRELIAKCGSKK